MTAKEFEAAFAQPIAFVLSTVLATGLVVLLLRAALVPGSRFSGWARAVTGRNARFLFGFLILAWIGGMSFLALAGLPHDKLGAPAFVGLLAGVFLFMGFIWSVIGE